MQPNNENQPVNTPAQMPSPAASSAQTPLQPATPSVGSGAQPPKKSKNKLILLIVALVVIVIGAIAAAVFFFNGAKAPSRGPALTVGSNPYIYACSVFDTDTVVTNLKFEGDKNKQVAEETYAFSPFDTENKEIDILKATGRENIPSACRIKTDIRFEDGPEGREPTFVPATLTLQQFANEQAAMAKFLETKSQYKNAKPLPSNRDKGFFAPQSEDSKYLNVFVQYKNMQFGYSIPQGSATPEEQASRTEKIHAEAIRRIEAGEGQTPKNYTGVNKIGDMPFIDLCQNTYFPKVAEAIGGNAEFDLALFNSNQNYSPSDAESDAPQAMSSICNTYFRTEKDMAAQSELAKQQPSAQFVNFPHQFMVQLIITKSPEDAQKYVTNFKKSGDEARGRDSSLGKIEEVQLGDKGVKTFNAAIKDAPFDSYLHYIAKDNHVYVISIMKRAQTEPYKTDTTPLTDGQMEKVFTTLVDGVNYAKSKLQ